MHTVRFWLMALCFGLLLAPSHSFAQPKGKYPDSAQGLQQLMGELYAATRDSEHATSRALIKSLILPGHETWFKRVFGDASGARAAAEYQAVLARFEPEIDQLMKKVVREGQSEIQIRRFDSAPHPQAVGLQNDAMTAMKRFQPLYSVRFVRPGERLGQHVYSFAYIDGGFRLVGKMQAVKP
jgi:hypothetical protein